ncbi:MAG: DinB family protein [Anaerolineae bacterium]|nr:DinB family protein [Anaerolineae bacterium]
MNASDILKYGNGTLQRSISDLTEAQWTTNGACGIWSPKDIMAHLASYEYVLVDVLGQFAGIQSKPHLDQYLAMGAAFNDELVKQHSDLSPQSMVAYYNSAHEESMTLIKQLTPELLRTPGTLPWYGAEYALDDYIVYAFYGHKREHSAQIDAFKDRLKA